jgi:hypothetical protein
MLHRLAAYSGYQPLREIGAHLTTHRRKEMIQTIAVFLMMALLAVTVVFYSLPIEAGENPDISLSWCLVLAGVCCVIYLIGSWRSGRYGR